MKIAAILAIVFIVGCKASTSPNGTTSTEGSMTATVNGSAWSTIGLPGAQTARATRDTSSGTVTVTGLNANLENLTNPSSITLILLRPSVGTVTLGTTGNEGIFAYGTVPKDGYISTSGSVSITKFDTVNRLISGNFNFTGTQILDTISKSVTVTNGSFLDVEWSK
ncbi:MAG: DUF6252 family protein [Bacteroidota bacterium]|nr:DUF6252 family protein [Bacteroidota bacterium]MDP4233151.1 DUF6252 family protein [Bacteroidota bacterium]MDP4241704.1 DUF6252 family protein [Bacteroidota bacterium]MDP4287362.1 DUF6252 family protein [Bacteroidota bacterium]